MHAYVLLLQYSTACACECALFPESSTHSERAERVPAAPYTRTNHAVPATACWHDHLGCLHSGASSSEIMRVWCGAAQVALPDVERSSSSDPAAVEHMRTRMFEWMSMAQSYHLDRLEAKCAGGGAAAAWVGPQPGCLGCRLLAVSAAATAMHHHRVPVCMAPAL